MHPPRISNGIALFLDFDGVLVEIAPNPDAVEVDPALRPALRRVYDYLGGAVAIVSGRMISDFDAYLAPLVLPASGSHGIERRWPDGRTEQPGDEIRAAAAAILADNRKILGDRPGLIFEQKDWSASLHFRGAPELAELCMAAMTEAVSRHEGWEVIEGKMVVEGRLAGVSKATAVELFMAEAPYRGRVPVFVGDDVTDEDGMRAAIAYGGYGVKVGAGQSLAKYRLGGPPDVLTYLQALAESGN